MAENIVLTAKEMQAIESATSLAENGNGSRLRDLLQNEKDFDKHTQIINSMLNLNQEHLTNFEIQERAGLAPPPVPRLKLDQVRRNENGDLLIMRSLSCDNNPIYREIYNNSKKQFVDKGSTPRPSGIIPGFIPHSN